MELLHALQLWVTPPPAAAAAGALGGRWGGRWCGRPEALPVAAGVPPRRAPGGWVGTGALQRLPGLTRSGQLGQAARGLWADGCRQRLGGEGLRGDGEGGTRHLPEAPEQEPPAGSRRARGGGVRPAGRGKRPGRAREKPAAPPAVPSPPNGGDKASCFPQDKRFNRRAAARAPPPGSAQPASCEAAAGQRERALSHGDPTSEMKKPENPKNHKEKDHDKTFSVIHGIVSCYGFSEHF